MSGPEDFTKRNYQKLILDSVLEISNRNQNVLLELDCGLGKRFLQFALIFEYYHSQKILLLLQASTSLYETYDYMTSTENSSEIGIIDSRKPSKLRRYIIEKSRVILSLPQTFYNTVSAYPELVKDFDIIIINEVDQLIRRMSHQTSLKQPYIRLLPGLADKIIIGMSGTIRDNHYVLDKDQLKIKEELKSLKEHIKESELITMEDILESDLEEHISLSYVVPTLILDKRMELLSSRLDNEIEKVKAGVYEELKKTDPQLYGLARKDSSILMGPLDIDEKLLTKFRSGYLVRKYLWAMSGDKSKFHLTNWGLEKSFLFRTSRPIPEKFKIIPKLVSESEKTVILCSYLDAVDLISEILDSEGIENVRITGKVNHNLRNEHLERFRRERTKIVAILSNVGERDIDIPEADQLIIFDLVRTTKTVYQKLKRSRGGLCRILYYGNTSEESKVLSVLRNIKANYGWTTQILNIEKVKFP